MSDVVWKRMSRKWGYYWKESRGVILSLVVTAAVLPMVLWAVVSRAQIFTWAGASRTDQLSVWFEPAEVVIRQGQSIKMDIVAEYSGGDRLIPELKSRITATSGLKVDPADVNYPSGFSGRKTLGSVQITALQKGEQNLSISEESVFTSLPDLPIVTAGAKVLVK